MSEAPQEVGRHASQPPDLPEVISIHAQRTSENLAVIIPRTERSEAVTITYAELNCAISCVQPDLASLGIGPGTKVALVVPNRIEFAVVFLATLRQRATTAPINPQYQAGEYQGLLSRIQPTIIVVLASATERDRLPPIYQAATDLQIPVATCAWDDGTKRLSLALQPLPSAPNMRPPPGLGVPLVPLDEVARQDPALLLPTSGTTGTPKMVMLTHENLLVSIGIIIREHGLCPRDRSMIITPMFHIGGICASLLCVLLSGGAAIIPLSLSGAFWTQFRDHGATWYQAVPTLQRLLLNFPRPKDLPPPRFIRCSGSALAADTLQRLETELQCPVLEVYGMTETAPGIFCNPFGVPYRLASYPIPREAQVQIRKLDDCAAGSPVLTTELGVLGEICVKGKSVMAGYVDNPAANAEAFVGEGFFRTGDLGVLEANNYVRLTGRLKEVINKGGEKIDPTEIEDIFLTFEAIQDAACFKVKDQAYGEDIGLAVVVKSGFTLSPQDVKKYARSKVVHFKVPKKVIFLDKIPCNQTGKYQRKVLMERYGASS